MTQGPCRTFLHNPNGRELMERYGDQQQPAEMSNQEFTDNVIGDNKGKNALHFWPRPENLLSLLTLVYGNDTTKIAAWLDDPTTEVDEYLAKWELAPQITGLNIFRRAATRAGTTFESLCLEAKELAETGGVPLQVQSFAAAGEKALTRNDSDSEARE